METQVRRHGGPLDTSPIQERATLPETNSHFASENRLFLLQKKGNEWIIIFQLVWFSGVNLLWWVHISTKRKIGACILAHKRNHDMFGTSIRSPFSWISMLQQPSTFNLLVDDDLSGLKKPAAWQPQLQRWLFPGEQEKTDSCWFLLFKTDERKVYPPEDSHTPWKATFPKRKILLPTIMFRGKPLNFRGLPVSKILVVFFGGFTYLYLDL